MKNRIKIQRPEVLAHGTSSVPSTAIITTVSSLRAAACLRGYVS